MAGIRGQELRRVRYEQCELRADNNLQGLGLKDALGECEEGVAPLEHYRISESRGPAVRVGEAWQWSPICEVLPRSFVADSNPSVEARTISSGALLGFGPMRECGLKL